MSIVGFYGSCPSEEFVKYAFPESELSFFCYGISIVSFMDDTPPALARMEQWPEALRKKLQFEAKKGFRERLRKAAPTTLVVDFTRASRASLIRCGDCVLTVPYELLEASASIQTKAFELFEVIPFGGREFWLLVAAAMTRFCDFLNREMPDTEIILLDVPPTSDYRGVQLAHDLFMVDFCRWQMRYPICRMLVDFCKERVKNNRVISPSVRLFSDDAAAYGPAPMHYAPKVWEQIAAEYHRNDGITGASNASDLVTTLTNYSGLMEYFTKAASSHSDLRRFGLDVLHGALPFLFDRLLDPSRNYFSTPVDPQDVVSAFRWILGREPETALTFLNHYALTNKRELRETLLKSAEFQNQVKHYAQP